jgi:hypothetical protein
MENMEIEHSIVEKDHNPFERNNQSHSNYTYMLMLKSFQHKSNCQVGFRPYVVDFKVSGTGFHVHRLPENPIVV